MKHLATFESYSDDSLQDLVGFGKRFGLVKREFDHDKFIMRGIDEKEANEELDFLESWTGNDGQKVTEIKGLFEIRQDAPYNGNFKFEISFSNDDEIELDGVIKGMDLVKPGNDADFISREGSSMASLIVFSGDSRRTLSAAIPSGYVVDKMQKGAGFFETILEYMENIKKR